ACALAHGKALREFFADEQILAIAEGRLDGILSLAEQSLVAFTRQIARDASQVTAAQVTALEEHGYSDAEIFDVVATAAGRAFFTKVLDALGVEPDSPFLELDLAFRRRLTVGRAIDESECVTMPSAEPVRDR
ncbi:MAG: peroxidase, partial [Deltaproteobacteria bacterium]